MSSRRLKTQHFAVAKNGQLRFCDFGILYHYRLQKLEVTHSGLVCCSTISPNILANSVSASGCANICISSYTPTMPTHPSSPIGIFQAQHAQALRRSPRFLLLLLRIFRAMSVSLETHSMVGISLCLTPLVSTFAPALSCAIYPGTAWLYHELIPTTLPLPLVSPILENRTRAGLWQLANCKFLVFRSTHELIIYIYAAYLLLGLIQSFGFRAIRDVLANNPAGQERILGASLMGLAFADVCSFVTS